MKKVNVKGKLSLGKETITKLSNEQMTKVVGGLRTQSATCWDTVTVVCQSTCFAWQGTLSCCA